MERSYVPLLTMALALIVPAGAVRADAIPYQASFDTVPPGVSSGGSSVAFTGHSGIGDGATPQTVPALTVQMFSSASAGTPDTFNQTVGVNLHLTDGPSGASTTVTIPLLVSGNLSRAGHSPNFITVPTVPIVVPLGEDVYTIQLSKGPAPTFTGEGQGQSVIRATISAAPVGVPEPTSLVLAALAVPALGLGYWHGGPISQTTI